MVRRVPRNRLQSSLKVALQKGDFWCPQSIFWFSEVGSWTTAAVFGRLLDFFCICLGFLKLLGASESSCVFRGFEQVVLLVPSHRLFFFKDRSPFWKDNVLQITKSFCEVASISPKWNQMNLTLAWPRVSYIIIQTSAWSISWRLYLKPINRHPNGRLLDLFQTFGSWQRATQKQKRQKHHRKIKKKHYKTTSASPEKGKQNCK